MGRWGILCALVLTVGSCGDDDDSASADATTVIDAMASIDATPPDASPPDANTCPAFGFGEIGGPCNDDSDCGANHFCVDETEEWPAAGYCTRGCTSNNDCAAGSSCRTLTPFGSGGGSMNDAGVPDAGPPSDAGDGPPPALCLPDCCAGDMCPTGQLCGDRLQGFFSLDGKSCTPGDSTAIDGEACAGSHECNVNSFCLEDLDAPGGYCATLGCVVGGANTCAPGGDGVCAGAPVGEVGVCLDTCTQQSDCRTSEGYKCVAIGQLNVCVHPDVGDPCTQNSDCGVTPWECFTAANGWPNGYCTVRNCDPTDEESCTDNSFCHDPDGTANNGDEYCVKSCEDANDCPNQSPGQYICNVETVGEPSGCHPD